MPEVTVSIGGDTLTYPTKKEMLQRVGYTILSGTDDPMTLRQLYYRFVGHDIIENKQSQYQYLSESIRDARVDGLIPWDWIEDRTRSTAAGDHNSGDYVTPASRFRGNLRHFVQTPERFHRPRWQYQDNYVELWVEKEALAGVFAGIASELKVVSFPSRGYTSISLLKDAADRMKVAVAEGKTPHILYFGDFDPSGQDIERNIRETLQETFSTAVYVHRHALTREQIDEFELPPQPAKRADARYASFVAEHGDMAVELDALPPDELRRLIRESAEEYFDDDVFAERVEPKQTEERERLREWIDVTVDTGDVHDDVIGFDPIEEWG